MFIPVLSRVADVFTSGCKSIICRRIVELWVFVVTGNLGLARAVRELCYRCACGDCSHTRGILPEVLSMNWLTWAIVEL